MEVEDLIKHYFHLGFNQDDILSHLRDDGVVMSSTTLKRKLKFLNLYRRKNYASVEDVITFLSGELEKSGSLLGYRWMWLRNDPKVIEGHYLDAVAEVGECRKTVRSDLGTKDRVVKAVQTELRSAISSQRPPSLYGKSVANQSIRR